MRSRDTIDCVLEADLGLLVEHIVDHFYLFGEFQLNLVDILEIFFLQLVLSLLWRWFRGGLGVEVCEVVRLFDFEILVYLADVGVHLYELVRKLDIFIKEG